MFETGYNFIRLVFYKFKGQTNEKIFNFINYIRYVNM